MLMMFAIRLFLKRDSTSSNQLILFLLIYIDVPNGYDYSLDRLEVSLSGTNTLKKRSLKPNEHTQSICAYIYLMLMVFRQ